LDRIHKEKYDSDKEDDVEDKDHPSRQNTTDSGKAQNEKDKKDKPKSRGFFSRKKSA
jgi:hypothetical protein